MLRRWLRDHISTGDMCSDAQTVCSELVSNAFDHADGPRSVRMLVDDDHVLIEVQDASTTTALTPGHSRLGASRGRGLALVAAMSRWGVRREHGGKTVWAALSAA